METRLTGKKQKSRELKAKACYRCQRQAGSSNLLTTLPQLLIALHLLILLKNYGFKGIMYPLRSRAQQRRRLRQEYTEFQTSLGHTARLSQIDKDDKIKISSYVN